ncbi:hypothetical protein [Streptomyces mirabilis]|uniref:hypothetical protein n=1 Tax=Streptomyces mirabilis TaxID=68239 RepID=UPI00324A7B7E
MVNAVERLFLMCVEDVLCLQQGRMVMLTGRMYRRFALALQALVHLKTSSTAWTEFVAYASAGQYRAQ